MFDTYKNDFCQWKIVFLFLKKKKSTKSSVIQGLDFTSHNYYSECHLLCVTRACRHIATPVPSDAKHAARVSSAWEDADLRHQ